jgi:hypothetical protein
MELKLHANARTTPNTRAYIQNSGKSVAELGVSETTIRRWKNRDSVLDRSHTPKRLAISLSPLEERLVCELRTALALPLDDIVEVMRRCLRHTVMRGLRPAHPLSPSPSTSLNGRAGRRGIMDRPIKSGDDENTGL